AMKRECRVHAASLRRLIREEVEEDNAAAAPPRPDPMVLLEPSVLASGVLIIRAHIDRHARDDPGLHGVIRRVGGVPQRTPVSNVRLSLHRHALFTPTCKNGRTRPPMLWCLRPKA